MPGGGGRPLPGCPAGGRVVPCGEGVATPWCQPPADSRALASLSVIPALSVSLSVSPSPPSIIFLSISISICSALSHYYFFLLLSFFPISLSLLCSRRGFVSCSLSISEFCASGSHWLSLSPFVLLFSLSSVQFSSVQYRFLHFSLQLNASLPLSMYLSSFLPFFLFFQSPSVHVLVSPSTSLSVPASPWLSCDPLPFPQPCNFSKLHTFNVWIKSSLSLVHLMQSRDFARDPIWKLSGHWEKVAA